jgi:hypothetical protein
LEQGKHGGIFPSLFSQTLRWEYSYSHLVLKKQLPFAVVAAFLRLGTKYEIPDLRAEATKRLVTDYPLGLELLEPRTNEKISIQPYYGKIFDVVNLAREMGILSILPVALYSCCCNDNQIILEGCYKQDGKYVALSSADQKICILAKDKLLAFQVQETFGWLGVDISEDICPQSRCKNLRKRVFQLIWLPKPKCVALEFWQPKWSDELCVHCGAAAHVVHVAGRAEIWRQLPSIFGLPGWDDLLKE